MENKERILEKIVLLTKQVPGTWAIIAAKELGKSPAAIYAYARGERGIRMGMHKQVLKILIRLVEKEQAENRELIKN